MPITFAVPCVLFLLSGFASAQDYTAELTRLIELADKNELRQAIAGYQKLAGDSGSPQWLKAASQYEIAELYAKLGDAQPAVAALQQAIGLGFDDCQAAIKSEPLGAVIGKSAIGDAVRGLSISEADYQELVWLKAEVDNAEHDAKMMITDNINRVDQQETQIPQAVIPARPTNSAAVLYWRQQLRLMQAAQREYVRKSDEERMTHAATMAVIGGGGNNAAVLESARLANAAAAARKLDIQKRAFKTPAETGKTVKPCS
jgi:hypothetical protein